MREVEEETGILGRVLAPLGTIDFWFVADDRRMHKTVHHFLLRAAGGELSDADVEVAEVAWVPLGELPSRGWPTPTSAGWSAGPPSCWRTARDRSGGLLDEAARSRPPRRRHRRAAAAAVLPVPPRHRGGRHASPRPPAPAA